MKTSEFVQLLQNELILPRDPHLADRFAALLEENYEPVAPKEPTPEDGVNIVPQEPSVTDPPPVESLPASTESEPPDYAGKAMDEKANAIQESEVR